MFKETLKNKNFRTTLIGVVFMATSCATVPKVEIPISANPTSELEKLDEAIARGYDNQVDILAAHEFAKAQADREDAKNAISRKDDQKTILDKIGYSWSYLNTANSKADEFKKNSEELLTARQRALNAGARGNSTEARLQKLDDTFRSYVPKISSMKVEKLQTLQAAYLDLEGTAIRDKQLGAAKSKILGAKKEGAEKFAPKSLRRAEMDLDAAELAIAANRNEPARFGDAVSKARANADFLSSVLKATEHGKVAELAAMKLVRQDSRINSLQAEVETSNATVSDQNAQLERKATELSTAERHLSAQQALDESRSKFTEDEAEVFQQGNRLVIRLKNMNFPTGSANLPADSLPLLAKVMDVTRRLGPKQIAVEGHTDSTGSAALNDRLSMERATAIAKYFASNGIDDDKITTAGYGFSRPIAPNNDQEGRAQNRRVDIVITPDATPAATNGNG